MIQLTVHDIEIIASMIHRCKQMNEFINEIIDNHMGNHPHRESLLAVIEHQNSILKAAVCDLTGDKRRYDEAEITKLALA